MLISAIFQSFYGLTEFFGGTERIFGYKKKLGLGSATGTYINRNHFSGFLEMIFPISLCYLFGYVFVKWRKRSDHFVKGVGLGCIMGIVAILIHSISDFNLRIPANAVYFVTLYALAIKTVDYRQKT